MFLYTVGCRIFQTVFKYGSALLPWRKPELLSGSGSLLLLPSLFQRRNISRILVVTDSTLADMHGFRKLIADLSENTIESVVYDKTVPNPTICNVEEAYHLFTEHKCQAILAFGGGSAMDCAKGVGIRVARPHTPLGKLKGTLKVLKKIPFLVAVPTTAGTGSEVTVAAVISDPATHEKYPINDLVLIPRAAVLDAELTTGLPKHLIATTGMDALTHAVEAFIGRSNTKETERNAIKAASLIFENLIPVYSGEGDTNGREKLLEAAHLAGLAFTRAYVGYAHAVAHSLGGFYGTPHGLANAVLLPIVLEAFGTAAHKRLAKLALHTGIAAAGTADAEAARLFIRKIRTMNTTLGIPQTLDCIMEADIPELAERALAEGNPLYPVPRIFGKKEMTQLYRAASGFERKLQNV